MYHKCPCISGYGHIEKKIVISRDKFMSFGSDGVDSLGCKG